MWLLLAKYWLQRPPIPTSKISLCPATLQYVPWPMLGGPAFSLLYRHVIIPAAYFNFYGQLLLRIFLRFSNLNASNEFIVSLHGFFKYGRRRRWGTDHVCKWWRSHIRKSIGAPSRFRSAILFCTKHMKKRCRLIGNYKVMQCRSFVTSRRTTSQVR